MIFAAPVSDGFETVRLPMGRGEIAVCRNYDATTDRVSGEQFK